MLIQCNICCQICPFLLLLLLSFEVFSPSFLPFFLRDAFWNSTLVASKSLKSIKQAFFFCFFSFFFSFFFFLSLDDDELEDESFPSAFLQFGHNWTRCYFTLKNATHVGFIMCKKSNESLLLSSWSTLSMQLSQQLRHVLTADIRSCKPEWQLWFYSYDFLSFGTSVPNVLPCPWKQTF